MVTKFSMSERLREAVVSEATDVLNGPVQAATELGNEAADLIDELVETVELCERTMNRDIRHQEVTRNDGREVVLSELIEAVLAKTQGDG